MHSFVEIDFARFDMSISYEIMLQFELFVLSSFFELDKDLIELLTCLTGALLTKGVSEIGLFYMMMGGRCSGDAHTSIGNGLLNHFLTVTLLSGLPTDAWVSFHEGDDGLIGIKEGYEDTVMHMLSFFPCFGFQVKVDKYNSLEETSFCGRYIFSDRDKADSYADPMRTLAKFHTSCSDGDPQSLMLAKAISYYMTDAGTPILGALTASIIRILLPIVSESRLRRGLQHIAKERYLLTVTDSELNKLTKALLQRIRNDKYPVVEPSAAARAAFALRTAITPGAQVRYEEYYKSWTYIPATVDKIPVDWTISEDAHVHGNPGEWVL